MVSPLLGAGAALASTFIPNFKVWNLANLDSNQVLQGQFEPVGLTREISTNWIEMTSLNRQNAILQFVNGSQETLSFTARFFRTNALGLDVQGAVFGGDLIDRAPEQKFEVLRSWTKIDPSLRRPPILQFWVGDGHIRMNCVLTSLSGVTYGRPDAFGGLRDISFTINLLEYSSFSLDDEEETDTRYARAKDRDYYELLAFQEYGDPLRGDIIRKDHPDKQRLRQGDIVKLPSIEGIRTQTVTQTSIPLKTAFGRKNTSQRRLRIEFFNKRSDSYVSHVLQPASATSRR